MEARTNRHSPANSILTAVPARLMDHGSEIGLDEMGAAAADALMRAVVR